MQQFQDDIEQLTRMPASWSDRDPTFIVESVLETLVSMMDLDFAGLRFSETVHVFLRTGDELAPLRHTQKLQQAIRDWLEQQAPDTAGSVHIGGHVMAAIAVTMGDIAGIGVLLAGSRRKSFPTLPEVLRLKVAATQASLACREVHELGHRTTPADTRPVKPTGSALAESEWRLNLIINTIPAMAWSATPDGILDFCNQNFLDFVGLPSEEILGLGFYRIFHPDDVAPLLGAWQDIMSSQRTREVEGRIRRTDGQYRWCTLRQNPLLDGNGHVVKWYGVVLDIEDRKRTENALQEARSALLASEQNLRLIVDSLPVLVWVARPDGSADFVNRRWAEYAGVDAAKILEWGFLDFYHPDDVNSMVDVWKEALASKEEMGLKGRIRRFDGEYRWFYFAGRKITDANGVERWVGANIEVEDLQRAEDALKASEQRLKLTIDTIPAMSWSADPQGGVDFFSKHFLDFCGLSAMDMRDDRFYRIFHPDDVGLLRSTWERVQATGRSEAVDGRVLRADGQYRWFTLQQKPLMDATGAVSKWYGSLFEIEDRKRAEEELRQSQSELARVTRMTTLGELAVSIAHEINQPLMALVTNAGTCVRWLDKDRFDVARAREAAERVVSEGHRAGEIVAGIRALARKEPVRTGPMDLIESIRGILRVLNGELRRRHVVVTFEGGPDAIMVTGDRTQLQQVLLNLIMNSVEAMTESKAKHIKIRAAAGDDAFAETSISDTGTGLPRDQMDRLFAPFFTTRSGGMGMGLSICRSIVESHGGTITARNVPSGGSIFSFRVPMAPQVS